MIKYISLIILTGCGGSGLNKEVEVVAPTPLVTINAMHI